MNSVHEAELSQPGLSKVASELLYSILQQDRTLLEGYKAELAKQEDRLFTNPSFLWMLLTKAIWECRADPVYILVDGVDRLKEGSCKELIRKILELRKIRKVKIFLSSRDVPYISKNLPHNTHEFIKINLDANSPANEDPETLTRSRANAWDWDVELSERAAETHQAKAEGTLPPALLVIESLKHLSLGSDFDEFLRKPQLGLEDVYEKMLDTLFSRGVPLEVLSTIWCVALALRPLAFGELGYMLVCIEEKTRAERDSSCKRTRREIQPKVEEEIRTYVQSSMGFLQATDTTVSIVHHTAIEYLFNQNNKGSLPVLSKSEVDLTIFLECFQYLHDVFGDPGQFPRGEARRHHNRSWDSSWGPDSGKELRVAPWEAARKDPQEAAAKWPYLRYAAESWFIRACRSTEICEDHFNDDYTHNWLQYQFFGTSDIIRKPWIELCGDVRMKALAGEQTPLHIAVCLGLMPLVKKTLSYVPMRLNYNFPRLHLSAKPTPRAYETLIANCGPSRLTALNKDTEAPPLIVALSGHSSTLVEQVETLRTLGYGAYSYEINNQNHFGNTPLHLALLFARPDMVELLVVSGADLNIMNNAQGTASELGENLGRGDFLDILKQARDVGKAKKGSAVRPRSRLLRKLWRRLQTKPQTSPGGAL